MADVPQRIWLDWPGANRGEVVYDEPPERETQPGQTGYILATPEALAAAPEVQALIRAAKAEGMREAAVYIEQRNGSIPYRQEIAAELRATAEKKPNRPCPKCLDTGWLRFRCGTPWRCSCNPAAEKLERG